MRLVARFMATVPTPKYAEFERINVLLASDIARKGYLLEYYTVDRLMSWEARIGWVEPDLLVIMEDTKDCGQAINGVTPGNPL